MIQNEHFKPLLEKYSNDYIGQGNPDSRILLIGKEHGFAGEAQNQLEIDNNIKDWNKIMDGRIKELDTRYNPRDGYLGQLFRTAGDNRTSMTWFRIQYLLHHVYRDSYPQTNNVDFLTRCFLTELSAIPNKTSKPKNKETAESINKRCGESGILREPFFRTFPVTIAYCSNYLDRYGIKLLEDTFDVKWDCKTQSCGNKWINVHYSKDKTRLLIHCPHISGSINSCFMEDLAGIVREHLQIG